MEVEAQLRVDLEAIAKMDFLDDAERLEMRKQRLAAFAALQTPAVQTGAASTRAQRSTEEREKDEFLAEVTLQIGTVQSPIAKGKVYTLLAKGDCNGDEFLRTKVAPLVAGPPLGNVLQWTLADTYRSEVQGICPFKGEGRAAEVARAAAWAWLVPLFAWITACSERIHRALSDDATRVIQEGIMGVLLHSTQSAAMLVVSRTLKQSAAVSKELEGNKETIKEVRVTTPKKSSRKASKAGSPSPARNSPTPGGNRVLYYPKRKCGTCGGQGHDTSACPGIQESKRSATCGTCGGHGHFARECVSKLRT
jgi:hypothetical protein